MTDATQRYVVGEYMSNNPTWHTEDSAWKAANIAKALAAAGLKPASVCDIGCGAGEVLSCLHGQMPGTVEFTGFDISPQALALAQSRQARNLTFRMGTPWEFGLAYDLALAIDVIEHVEDYFAFLRHIAGICSYCIVHIPLEANVNCILHRGQLELRRAQFGHIHHFTKNWVFSILRETGFEVVRADYTCLQIERPPRSMRQRVGDPMRRMLFRRWPDFAAALLGGFSLLIVAKSQHADQALRAVPAERNI
jgi:SAM-dependent methyltransferase